MAYHFSDARPASFSFSSTDQSITFPSRNTHRLWVFSDPDLHALPKPSNFNISDPAGFHLAAHTLMNGWSDAASTSLFASFSHLFQCNPKRLRVLVLAYSFRSAVRSFFYAVSLWRLLPQSKCSHRSKSYDSRLHPDDQSPTNLHFFW